METQIILKLPSKMPIYAEKNMQYVHFAGKCGNKQNMRQSHVHIKLTCLAVGIWWFTSDSQYAIG